MKNIPLVYLFAAFLVLVVLIPALDANFFSGGFSLVSKISAGIGAILALYMVYMAFFGKKQ